MKSLAALLCVAMLSLPLSLEFDWRLANATQLKGSEAQAQYLSLADLHTAPTAIARIDSQPVQQQMLIYKNFYFWMNYIVVTAIGLGIRGII